jgi:hypothetical protein
MPGKDIGDSSLELTHIEVIVETLVSHHFFVASAFDNLPVIDDQDLVCMPNRAEAVGDDKTRPALLQFPERFLDIPLSPGIDIARRLVKD